MARLTLIMTVMATIVALLGGFRWLLDTIRDLRWHKKQTGRWLTVLVILVPVTAEAGTYYVSASSGNTTWATCTNIATPCTIGTAFANAVAGDTVNFRGGTYDLGQHNSGDTYNGIYNFANAGTSGNPIVFQAYTGETPILDGEFGGSAESGNPDICFVSMIGMNKNYVTMSGFTWQAHTTAGGVGSRTSMPRVMIGHQGSGGEQTGMRFTGNTMYGGPDCDSTHNDNNEGIRIERTDNTRIDHNILHDFIESGGIALDTTTVKTYHNTNLLIENNEFDNAHGAIYLKSNTQTATIRYNWIHDSQSSIEVSTNVQAHDGVQIYHNLISKCTNVGIKINATDSSIANLKIYNNTVYCPTLSTTPSYGSLFVGANTQSLSGFEAYNNILQSAEGSDYNTKVLWAQNGGTATTIDYNNYATSPEVQCTGSIYTTLATIKSATCFGLTNGNHDVNSIATDPTYTNTSGSLNAIADFVLTAASAGYQAGSDGNDMGANMSLVGTGVTGGGSSGTMALFLRVAGPFSVAMEGLLFGGYLWRRRSQTVQAAMQIWRYVLETPKEMYWVTKYKRAVKRWQKQAPVMLPAPIQVLDTVKSPACEVR